MAVTGALVKFYENPEYRFVKKEFFLELACLGTLFLFGDIIFLLLFRMVNYCAQRCCNNGIHIAWSWTT